MNSKYVVKQSIMAYIATILLFAASSTSAFANNDDEFGIWTTVEASKKLSQKMELDFEGEFRTQDGLQLVDRWSGGIGLSYKMRNWLKADCGYIYIYSFQPGEKSEKDYEEFEGTKYYNYNYDNPYWVSKHRYYLSLSTSCKVGRFSISLRERLQYTRSEMTTTYEEKWRWSYVNGIDNPPTMLLDSKSGEEVKSEKRRTILRSRLNVKYDIANCKFTPFASIELYSRTDDWKFHDKIRYRIGSDYKINKKNSVSFYYLYQDANDQDEPAGHAIGLGYSVKL